MNHVHVWRFVSCRIVFSFFNRKRNIYSYECTCGKTKEQSLILPSKQKELRLAKISIYRG